MNTRRKNQDLCPLLINSTVIHFPREENVLNQNTMNARHTYAKKKYFDSLGHLALALNIGTNIGTKPDDDVVETFVANAMAKWEKYTICSVTFHPYLAISPIDCQYANMFFIDGWWRIVGRYFSCIRSLHQRTQDYGLYTAHIQGKCRSLKPSLRTFQKHLEYLQSQSHHQPLHHLFHYEICSVGFRRHVRRQPEQRRPGQ
jgi:hypothetical protein